MILAAYINLWGKRVGAIVWNPDTNISSFEFDPDFKKLSWDVSPIVMPISSEEIFAFPELQKSTTFKGMPGLVADVLPDKFGTTLINAWLTQSGRAANSMNPVEMLCYIGTRGMGALEFEPAQAKGPDTATKVDMESLVDMAGKVLNTRSGFTANLSEEKALFDILKVGTSAGGARAKAVIAYNELTGEVRSGQSKVPKGFGHWLLKFDGVSDYQLGSTAGYGRVEMAYHLMAKDCEIEMMECRLLEENGRAHFMTKRFDRTPDNEKLHIQTFCALMHYDFNEIHTFAYEQLFQLMRVLRLPYPQAEQLYRRMVLNVIARNCDDHTKNFSFIMNKRGEWRLSPAYDVCHAYSPDSIWVSHHALSVNGKRQNITRNDLLSVAQQMNIKKADSIISQVAEVVSRWPEYAKETGVEKKLTEAIDKTLLKL